MANENGKWFNGNNVPTKKRRFVWTVEFAVDETWVEDGFELDAEQALGMLSERLGYATIGTELNARIVKSPDSDRVAVAQGYASAADRKKRGG